MKLLSVEMARVGAIVRLDEVFPLTGVYPPTIARAVAERYSFIYQPDWSLPLSEMQSKGMEFRAGKFQAGDGTEHVIHNLTIVAFGIVASTYSTETTKQFLEDLFSWADKEYECRFSTSDMRFFFLSQLVVELDRSINILMKGFDVLSREIGNAIEGTYGKAYPIEVSNITFNYDRTSILEEMKQLSEFNIERQADKPFSSNRFFCSAPLSTRDHIALLEQLEHELGK